MTCGRSTPPRETPWLRVNMVSTVDGAATGESGLTASINNEPDQRVFHLLRELADCVVVGAGTARTEGYPPLDVPTVVVSRSGSVPEKMRGAEPGRGAAGDRQRGRAGSRPRGTCSAPDNVLVLGSHRVDLAALKQSLVDRGFGDILCEGGPHLLRDLLDQGVADELDCTFVPRLVAGVQSAHHRRPAGRRAPDAADARRGGRHPAGALVHALSRASSAGRRLGQRMIHLLVVVVRMTMTTPPSSVRLALLSRQEVSPSGMAP